MIYGYNKVLDFVSCYRIFNVESLGCLISKAYEGYLTKLLKIWERKGSC